MFSHRLPQPTDFKKLLKNHVKDLHHDVPFDPEQHDFIKQFKEAVWVSLLMFLH